MFKSKVESSSLNPLAKAEFESNKAAVDSNIPEVAIKAEESVSLTSASETVVPAVIEKKNYYIITGSFKVKQNAELQADILSKEGYTPEIIEGPNGFYRVSAMQCVDVNAAEVKKDSISQKFPGSWVKKI